MAEYPSHLVTERRLRDGRTVTLRPIRAADASLERAFVNGLSGESRYLRFQKWVHEPSEKLVRFLTDVDYERHMAFACTFERDARQELVGQARYVVNPDGESCELGIVVADDWQKSGIAGLLMDALLRAARARGLKRMEGIVLANNSGMLRFARMLGFKVHPSPDDRTLVRIEKAL